MSPIVRIDENACAKAGIPTEPEKCMDEKECFAKAKAEIEMCNATKHPIRIADKYICTKCWEIYATQCPAKSKDKDCSEKECL